MVNRANFANNCGAGIVYGIETQYYGDQAKSNAQLVQEIEHRAKLGGINFISLNNNQEKKFGQLLKDNGWIQILSGVYNPIHPEKGHFTSYYYREVYPEKNCITPTVPEWRAARLKKDAEERAKAKAKAAEAAKARVEQRNAEQIRNERRLEHIRNLRINAVDPARHRALRRQEIALLKKLDRWDYYGRREVPRQAPLPNNVIDLTL